MNLLKIFGSTEAIANTDIKTLHKYFDNQGRKITFL